MLHSMVNVAYSVISCWNEIKICRFFCVFFIAHPFAMGFFQIGCIFHMDGEILWHENLLLDGVVCFNCEYKWMH